MPHLPRTLMAILIFAALILTSGCTSLLEPEETAAPVFADDTLPPSSYQVTIAQPDSRSDYIRMDSDVYNEGEVVEFYVVNNDLLPLECSNTPPDFRVIFQTGSGWWATKMGPEVPKKGNISYIQKGGSTEVYRFVTQGWEAGRYRILSDCGVERDILIRALPTPVPTATPCPVTNDTPAGSWIKIDPIPEQQAASPFTISGTTNLPAGTELYYVIFSVLAGPQKPSLSKEASFSTIVEAGSCGINSWSATGEIQATGDFFIGIEDRERSVTAIKRFTVSL